MLEKNTECWICKRTETEIIAEIKNRKWSESIFDEVLKEYEKYGKGKGRAGDYRTEKGLITLEDVGNLGYSYPLCAFCAGLIYTIANESATDRLDYEKDEGYLLTGDTIFKPEARE